VQNVANAIQSYPHCARIEKHLLLYARQQS